MLYHIPEEESTQILPAIAKEESILRCQLTTFKWGTEWRKVVMTANRHELTEQLHKYIPQELHLLSQWLVWRLVERDGKYTKVPYSPSSGELASSTKPATWTSFEQACQAYNTGNYSGLGFVFSQHDSYVGVDFDDCITNGKIGAVQQAYLQQLDSYTEFSQSGSGLHVILRGALPERGRKSTQHRIEMYEHSRFFVMTGNHVPDMPLTINNRESAITNGCNFQTVSTSVRKCVS